jgi:isocitrate dehydrogenase (NAD+)
MREVAIIRGDGIGPEISEATQQVLETAGAALRWQEVILGQEAKRRWGSELPAESVERIRRIGVALKAPLIAEPRSGGLWIEGHGERRRYPSVNNGLRRELGAYANLRPVLGFPGVSGRYQNLDIILVRELTEDTYAGIERQPEEGRAEAVKLVTREASERIARFACDYAVRHGRRKITAVHKANVLHLADGLFLESVRGVVAQHPELSFDDRMVDAACYLMVKEPGLFDVLVLPNQYGDILSDLAAGLVGSLGLVPGVNIGPGVAVFEAAHGAAPDIAGKGIANPIGLILSGAMLLDHLGQREAAERVRRAVARVLAAGRCQTPDLGGHSSTRELTRAICAEIECT